MTDSNSKSARWNPRSVAIIVLAWLILYIGCLFTPGLLDDVDSIYIEIAREMLLRHDYVTPMIDGVRFFDKPPLMYWLAAGSMHLFGQTAWAARLPIALATLALLLAVYGLGLRLLSSSSPETHPDRGALYAALAVTTSIGPFLYTRFFIPDIMICLWMTLGVHLFLIALDRIQPHNRVPRVSPLRPGLTATEPPASAHRVPQVSLLRPGLTATDSPASAHRVPRVSLLRPELTATEPPASDHRVPQVSPLRPGLTATEPPASAHRVPRVSPPGTGLTATDSPASALLPCLAFAAVTALNLLTKGLIGLVFPLAFVLLYLAITRQLRALSKMHLIPSALVFTAIAAPWHILAALRNPAIALPPGLGLPAHGGWAWFYLYNEHIARFLSKRIPHDYGQTPVWLFWLYAAIWLFPWIAFLPGAIVEQMRTLRTRIATPEEKQPALTLLLWPAIVLGFFTLSARQEYYSLPALPALALLAGGLLARADSSIASGRAALHGHRWLLLPLGTLAAAIAAFFAITAPHPAPNTDIATLLAQGGEYDLSLGHIFDLTGAAMGLFRGPLILFGLSMLTTGPIAYLLRARGRLFAANLTVAAAAMGLLLAVHSGLTRFYPTIGSQPLADAILAEQSAHPAFTATPDLILIDGELTAGSTLIFYTRQQVHLVNGRMNGPWYGSFWPDAPHIFETETTLQQLWAGPQRIYLLTYHPATRSENLNRLAPVHTLANSGGKAILVNRP